MAINILNFIANIISAVVESQSTRRRTYFDRINYHYQKCRKRVYIHSIDFAIWNVIENGSYAVQLVRTDVGESVAEASEPGQGSALGKLLV